jgi:hypothetical protein
MPPPPPTRSTSQHRQQQMYSAQDEGPPAAQALEAEAEEEQETPKPVFKPPPPPARAKPLQAPPPPKPRTPSPVYAEQEDAPEEEALPPVQPRPAPSPRQQQKQHQDRDYLFVAYCTFDFDPDAADELELRVGDRVEVLATGKDGWWRGRLELPDGAEEVGVFPSTYVEREAESMPSPPAASPRPAPAAAQTSPRAISASPPTRPDPVEVYGQAVFAAPAPQVSAEHLPAVALFDFVPGDAGELALQKGQSLYVLDRSDPDWWLGVTTDGRRGLFPYNYAQLVATLPTAAAPPVSAPAAAAARPLLVKEKSGRQRPPAPRPPAPAPPPAAAAARPVPATMPPAAEEAAIAQWKVTAEAFLRYCQFFEQQNKDELGRLAGRETAKFLEQSGLARPAIASILELADMDGDKMFDRDEFAIAMHLALCISKRGMPLPDTLPGYMIPKSKKHLR